MTTLHRIMGAICRALAVSGVARWEGKFVKVAEVREIEMGRQGAAEMIATNGRGLDPFTDTSREH